MEFIVFIISYVIIFLIMTVVCGGVMGSILGMAIMDKIPHKRKIKLNKYVRKTLGFIIIVGVIMVVQLLFDTKSSIFTGAVAGVINGFLSYFFDAVSEEAAHVK